MTDWEKIKTEYISTEISQRKLAEKYGVSVNTLIKRANKEGWATEREKHHNRVTTRVQQKIVTAQANETFDAVKELYKSRDMRIKKSAEIMTDACFTAKDLQAITSALKTLYELTGINVFAEDEEDNGTGVILIAPVKEKPEDA